MSDGPFHGKFRARVVGNNDPLGIGCIEVEVPDVTGRNRSTPAMPCMPLAGNTRGLFSVPPVGSGVWVEYEGGDLEKPIWVGGYWGANHERPTLTPTTGPTIDAVTLATANGHGLVISDAPGAQGGILIKAAGGASISVSDEGIVIDNGKGAVIKLQGQQVNVNQGALTVD